MPMVGRDEFSPTALTYTASLIVGLAAWQARRPDLIRSPKLVLAHLWDDSWFGNALFIMILYCC